VTMVEGEPSLSSDRTSATTSNSEGLLMVALDEGFNDDAQPWSSIAWHQRGCGDGGKEHD
jgi:hypothetical protein